MKLLLLSILFCSIIITASAHTEYKEEVDSEYKASDMMDDL